MGKFYVPDGHGNYREYESETDYMRHEREEGQRTFEWCVNVLSSKVFYTVSALWCAWWDGVPLWISIVLIVLAIVNIFLPNSDSSRFMRIFRSISVIGIYILASFFADLL